MEQKSVSRFTVFLSLAIGFMVLGFSGSYVLFTGAKENYFNQVAENLKSIAAMSALQIDPKAIESLNQPDQIKSPEFESQSQILNKIVTANPHITHISVLKSIGPQYHYIVDASSLGQKGSKSELLDPADDIPTGLTRAVTEQTAIGSVTPHSDRWGDWYSAYSPILDANGETVAVVQIDADAKETNVPSESLQLQFKITLTILIVASLLIAWLTSGPVTSGLTTLKRTTKSPFSKSFVELTLAIIILAISIDLGFAISRQFQIIHQSGELASLHSVIHKANSISQEFRKGNPPSESELKDIKPLFVQMRQGQMYDSIVSLNSPVGSLTSNPEIVDKATTTLESRVRSLSGEVARLENAQTQSTSRALFGFLLISAVAIILLRYITHQDNRIDHTVVTSNSIQSQLSSLVENLPVGLFVLEAGKISFANSEFISQVGETETNITLDALSASIHPDDRIEVMTTITNSANVSKPFRSQYRISRIGAPTLHVETRGVPVYDNDGVCRKMLAFTVDFSAAVEAKHALEEAYGEVEHKNQLLSNALAELEINLESVVKALVKAVEAKDPYTAGHSERVMQYSMWLGEAIGLGPYEKRILELGTLVHDVGKIGIPDAILTKPDRLTEEEYDIIKKHPEYGVNIISDIEMFRECIPIVRWHHERLDGRGYPDQLKGDEIPMLVRISAIADIFDAMTSTRAYRKGMDLDNVLNIMNDLAEKGEIDSDLFITFCQVIHQRGIVNQQVQQEPWKAA
ncbi:MAG: HD domain-containing phosphohydrolase [Fimbriimonadaceae bacterium]